MAVVKAKVNAVPELTAVNFLSLDFYVGGGALPEGDYVWEKVEVLMHSGFDASKAGVPRLGVMIHLKDLRDLKAEVRPIFCSMGTKAHLSFAPNANTGKGLVAIPGAVGSNLNPSTNWAILFKSIIDSDPTVASIASNDVGIFEGMWAHMQSIPEPKERAEFGKAAATGEGGQQGEERKAGTTPVVTSILDEGKPWEGTGGVPAESPFAKEAAALVGKVTKAAAPVAKATPAAAPVVDADEDLKIATINGLTEVLTKNPNGCSKLLARSGTFNAIKAAQDEGMANSALNTYFASAATDDALNSLLGDLGYNLSGGAIKLLQ